ncbi:hypothetical protein ACL6C3_10055 [Capilliphycus salinus ALCB114379]|uniref:hypothetical protein n=1 Tax=Capilliphycus salinus TaxID=2768948 RepID=UPI0039A680D6
MNSADASISSSSIILYGLLLVVGVLTLGLVWILFDHTKSAEEDHRHHSAQIAAFIYDPSNYWFHWKYTRQDKFWISRSEFYTGLSILFLCPIVFGILCLCFGVYDFVTHPTYYQFPLQEILDGMYHGMVLGGILGVIGFIVSGVKAISRLIQIEDVYIGSSAICHGGKYCSWNDSLSLLSEVKLSGRTLEFEFEHCIPEDKQDKSFQLTGYRSETEQSETSSKTVYVPLGKETEALEVVKRLQPICVKKPVVVNHNYYYIDNDCDHYCEHDCERDYDEDCSDYDEDNYNDYDDGGSDSD